MGKRKQKSVSSGDMVVSHVATDDLSGIEALLSDVVVPGDESVEVVEQVEIEGLFGPSDESTDPVIESLGEVVEPTVEVPAESFAEALGATEDVAAVLPTVEPATVVETIPGVDPVIAAKRAAKAAEKAARAAARAEKAAQKAAEKANKPKRIFFGKNKVARLKHTMGDKLGDFLVLTIDDASKEGDELKAAQDDALAIISCRLITPPNGLILDPFMGSGSTGKAAVLEGFRFMGLDITEEYMPIAEARIKWAEANAGMEVEGEGEVAEDGADLTLF